MTSPEEKKSVRPGSARAKLEAFEREQKGKKGLLMRLGFLGGLAGVLVLAMTWLNREEGTEWYDSPKDAAYLARSGKWEQLEKLFSKDFVLDGLAGVGPAPLVSLIRQRGAEGLDVFATDPHKWGVAENGQRIRFWVIYNRGDLDKGETVPLVRSWFVEADIVKEGERWVFSRAKARETMSPGR